MDLNHPRHILCFQMLREVAGFVVRNQFCVAVRIDLDFADTAVEYFIVQPGINGDIQYAADKITDYVPVA